MHQKGRLEVICGSMFSGKTEELMRRLRRSEYAKLQVITIKHAIDNRGAFSCIISHNGEKREAHPITDCDEGLSMLSKLVNEPVDVIGIDEIQFFSQETIRVIQQLVAAGKRIIVSGLDLDFRGEPFGIVPTLMALADDVVKLRAICMCCGADAFQTQRLVDGKPARYDDETICVGAKELYEARCRTCFSMS